MSPAPEPRSPQCTVRLLWTVPETAPEQAVTRSVGWMRGEELARWERLHHAPSRRASALARLLMRSLLADATGLPPDAFGFTFGAHGRPEPLFRGSDRGVALPSINCAHSRGLVVAAAALVDDHATARIGVDCEPLDRSPPRRGLDRFFAAEETAELARLSDAERSGRFWRLWTLKEAWLKARGTGIAGSLSSSRIAFAGPGSPRLTAARDDDPERWQLHEPQITSDHQVGVAVELAAEQVPEFRIEPLTS